MRIAKAARETGLSVNTIKYYGKMDLLTLDYHNTKHTIYDILENDIRTLNRVKIFRKAGFTIDETRHLLENTKMIPLIICEWSERLNREKKRVQLIKVADEIIISNEIDCRAIAKKLASNVRNIELPVEDLIPELVIPKEINKIDREGYARKQLRKQEKRRILYGLVLVLLNIMYVYSLINYIYISVLQEKNMLFVGVYSALVLFILYKINTGSPLARKFFGIASIISGVSLIVLNVLLWNVEGINKIDLVLIERANSNSFILIIILNCICNIGTGFILLFHSGFIKYLKQNGQ